MPTGIVTIASFTPEPAIQVDSNSVVVLRAWYSNDFISGDGTTPIQGNPTGGQEGFYYEFDCTIDGNGLVVIPALAVQATTLSNPTANFFAQLYVDGAAILPMIIPNTQGATGWQVPTVYGATMTFAELALYNRAKRLVYPNDTYFTADQTIQEIQLLAGNFDYSAVGINGIGSLDVAPVLASLPIFIGANNPRQPTLSSAVIWASQYASFNLALSAITTLGGGTLFVDASCPVTASVATTLPVSVVFVGQGLLTGSGKTVTFVGPVDGPPRQLWQSGITILWTGNNVQRELLADWWNVVGDNTDRITQLQAASDSLATFGTFTGGHRLLLPAGQIKMSATWTIQFVEGVDVGGVGWGNLAADSTARSATHLIWSGAAGGTMMVVNGVGYSHFHDFVLHGAGLADILIDNDQRVGYQRINTANVYERIMFIAEGTRATFVGFWNAKTSNNNCEDIVLNDCQFEISTNQAYNTAVGTGAQIGVFGVSGGNAFGIQFNDCLFTSGAFGISGGVYYVNGGFVSFNGVDYRFLSGSFAGSVDFVSSEHSGQFIVAEQGCQVFIRGNRVGDVKRPASALISKAAFSGSLSGGTGAVLLVEGNTLGDQGVAQIFYDGGSSSFLQSAGNNYGNKTGSSFALSSFPMLPIFGRGDMGGGAADPTFAFYTSRSFLTSSGIGATVAGSSTTYTTFGGAILFNATEALRQFAIPPAIGSAGGGGVMRSLSVTTSTTQGTGSSGSMVITLRVNGVDTAMTVTRGGGAGAGNFTDIAHPIVVAAGDLISFKVVNNDSATSAAIIQITCEYDPI